MWWYGGALRRRRYIPTNRNFLVFLEIQVEQDGLGELWAAHSERRCKPFLLRWGFWDL